MTVQFTEDEIHGLMEAIDRGTDEQTEYLKTGDTRGDHGSEWPETARERARRWDLAASACRKLEAESMAEACETLARAFRQSAATMEIERFCPYCDTTRTMTQTGDLVQCQSCGWDINVCAACAEPENGRDIGECTSEVAGVADCRGVTVVGILPAADDESICTSCGGDKDAGGSCPFCFIPV